jgi:hypothetical protein
MNPTLREWLNRVLLVLVTLLLGWVFWPRGSELGNASYDTSDQRVVIIPSGSIPVGFLRNLERALEEQHGFNILISPEMGLDQKWLIPQTNQYSAPILAQQGIRLLNTGQTH